MEDVQEIVGEKDLIDTERSDTYRSVKTKLGHTALKVTNGFYAGPQTVSFTRGCLICERDSFGNCSRR